MARIRDRFFGFDVVGQHRQHALDEVLPPSQLVGDLVEVVAIGRHAAFGLLDFGLAIEQVSAFALRLVLQHAHHGHRAAPGEHRGKGTPGRQHLHFRCQGYEANLPPRSHEELAIGKPAPQAVTYSAGGCVFQVGPHARCFVGQGLAAHLLTLKSSRQTWGESSWIRDES